MKTMRLLFSLVAISVVTLAGCAVEQTAPQFREDSYVYRISFQDKWSVQFDDAGKVTVEVDQQGTINVYASPAGGNQRLPDVRISGPAKFAVHGCNRVTVCNDATVAAFGCSTVRARAGTTVDAHNCELIEAYGAVKEVRAHGSTKVSKFPEPGTVLPAVSAPASAPTTKSSLPAPSTGK